MKQTKEPLPPHTTNQSIKEQEMDLRLRISETERSLIRTAQHIAEGKGISMVDYSDYNRQMASMKQLTTEYLNFTRKYRNSL